MFNLKNQNMAPKVVNFKIIVPFDIPHSLQFRQFLHSPFDINQLSKFSFPTLVTRKFGNSTFERSLIFRFETSAILKFHCLKFEPSSVISLN